MANKDADIRKTPPVFVASQTLDNGDTMDLKPDQQGIDRIEVHNINHGADCDVSIHADTTDDGNYNRSVPLDSFSGSGVSQGNEIEVTAGDMMFRITDTSGNTGNDYIVTGVEL